LDETLQSSLNFSASRNDNSVLLYNVSLSDENGVQTDCSIAIVNSKSNGKGNLAGKLIAIWGDDIMPSHSYPRSICLNTILLEWSRAWADDGYVEDEAMKRELMIYQPRLASALFDITVDPAGRVIHANRVSDLQGYSTSSGPEIPLYLLRNANYSLVLNGYAGDSYIRMWHNDTVTRNWASYIMKLAGSDVTDPLTTPDLEILIP
jgi:hypothetical protein